MLPIICLDDLGAYLRKDLTGDNLGVIALDAASQIVRGYTGLTINPVASETVTLNGNGATTMLLDNPPVSGVDSVEVDGVALVEGTDFEWTTAGILYRLDGYTWTSGVKNVEVVYDHGWPTTGDNAIPSDLRFIALQVAARIYDAGIAAQETTGSYNVTYIAGAGGLNEYEKRVLDKHRVSRVM